MHQATPNKSVVPQISEKKLRSEWAMILYVIKTPTMSLNLEYS